MCGLKSSTTLSLTCIPENESKQDRNGSPVCQWPPWPHIDLKFVPRQRQGRPWLLKPSFQPAMRIFGFPGSSLSLEQAADKLRCYFVIPKHTHCLTQRCDRTQCWYFQRFKELYGDPWRWITNRSFQGMAMASFVRAEFQRLPGIACLMEADRKAKRAARLQILL